MNKQDFLTLLMIINGLLTPVIVGYIRKISISMTKVDLLDARFDLSIKTLDSIVTKVDGLLHESVVSKEQLSYLKSQVNDLRQRSHELGNLIAEIQSKVMKLEGRHED